MSRIARPAALVAGPEGGHSETSKHMFCVNLSAMALACAAQWFGGWLVGAAGPREKANSV